MATNFDWPGHKRDLAKLPWERDEDGQLHRRVWLGSLTALYPSGKIYSGWTTNQTEEDEAADEAYQDALDAEAGEHGLVIECDGNALFAVEYIEEDE